MTRCNSCRQDVEPRRCQLEKGRDLLLCPRCGGPGATKFTLVEKGRGRALGHSVGAASVRSQP